MEGRVKHRRINSAISHTLARRFGYSIPLIVKPEPALTTRSHLDPIFEIIGDEFVHPDLPGRKYNEQILNVVVDIVNCAELKYLEKSNDGAFTPQREKIADMLLEDPVFRVATMKWDVRYQVKFALEVLDYERHVRSLICSYDESIAKGLAKIDIEDANEISKKFLDLEYRSNSQLIPAAMEFFQYFKEDMSVFQFVLVNLESIRWVTDRAKKVGFGEAVKEYQKATSILNHEWLTPYIFYRLKESTVDARFAVSLEVEAIEIFAEKFPASDTETREYIISIAKDATHIFDSYQRNSDTRDVRRLARLIRLNPKTNIFSLALDIAEENLERKKTEELLYVLQAPLPDQELEEFLKGQPSIIAHVARSLNHFALLKTPFKDVPDIFKPAVSRLRVSLSIESIFAEATKIEEKLPKFEKYPSLNEDLGTDDFDNLLSNLEFGEIDYLQNHFGNYIPSSSLFSNAIKLINKCQIDSDKSYSIISGSYDEAGIIRTFYEKGERTFRFYLNRTTGEITLLKGFERPEIAFLDGMKILDPDSNVPGIVFPLPNLGISPEMESILNSKYPRKNADGKDNLRNVTIRRVARHILGYLYIHSSREDVSDLFKSKLSRYMPDKIDYSIPVIYQESYNLLKDDFTYQKVISEAVRLVDSSCIPKEAKSSSTTMIPIIATQEEKEFIAAVLNNLECTEDHLEVFLTMDSGKRELAVRNYLASLSPIELSDANIARISLYQKFNIELPTDSEKRKAVLDHKNLSSIQLELIGKLFAIPADSVNDDHIYGFRVWAFADSKMKEDYWMEHHPDFFDLLELSSAIKEKRKLSKEQKILFRKILSKKWHQRITKYDLEKIQQVSNRIEALQANKQLWLNSRDALWKDEGLLSISEFVYNLRQSNSFPDPKSLAVLRVIQGNTVDPEKAKLALIQKSSSDGVRTYYPEVINLCKHYDISLQNLADCSKKSRHFNVLLDFLGEENVHPVATLSLKRGMTQQKNKQGSINEDSYTSIQFSDNSTLHAIFDGMGGHGNGDIASKIAKNTLEIFAFSGWIKSPRDIVVALQAIDLAIVNEQISMKKQNNHSVESRMGTTAVITLRNGNEFYGIHVGDSPYKIFRNGRVVFESIDHDITYSFQKLVLNDPTLSEEERKTRLVELAQLDVNHRNVIVSALGAATEFISVNNDSNYPFYLQKGDIISLFSDGISDVVTNEEMLTILEVTQKNFPNAAKKLIILAQNRGDSKSNYDTIHGRHKVQGKGSDDKTVIFEEVGGADS